MTVRVVIADDHPTFVRAVTLLLNSDPDIEVVATAENGADAIESALEHQPDVVLMDIDMPSVDGIEATKRIRDAAPHIAVVALTMFDDDEKVAAIMRGGASGYLLKGARQDQIKRAIHAAHAGEAIFDSAIARRLKDVFEERPAREVGDAFPNLTRKESAVLDRVAAGLDNAAIASVLFLSEKTVRNYVSTIFAKLHVGTRAAAIVAAREAGLGR